MRTRSTESRCVIGPENILFVCASVNLSARKFYRLDSEGVNYCLSVVLLLYNGITPKICRVCFCPNKYLSFEAFICLGLVNYDSTFVVFRFPSFCCSL